MTTKINKSHLILLKIIEKHGNKYCADCGVEGTRWASWNFGIFLCIRCAGIHRNLGVHISKVKSVDLDSWTSEQLQVMEEVGNRKSQQIYEAALPDHFMRPQTNYAIEEFIRAKYQHKRYCIESPNATIQKPDAVKEPPQQSVNNDRQQRKEVIGVAANDGDVFPAVSDDDSLSDPEYLIDLKEKPQQQQQRPCHKVHSDGDLISFNIGSISSGGAGGSDSANLDSKMQILSLYDQAKLNGGYQSSLPTNSSSTHHKSYGSSADTQFHSMTGIPTSNQNSYLKQIQDKLSVIKDNLTSKFRQYEQPGNHTDPNQSVHSGVQSSFQRHTESSSQHHINNSNSNRNGFQTLSPDLWR